MAQTLRQFDFELIEKTVQDCRHSLHDDRTIFHTVRAESETLMTQTMQGQAGTQHHATVEEALNDMEKKYQKQEALLDALERGNNAQRDIQEHSSARFSKMSLNHH